MQYVAVRASPATWSSPMVAPGSQPPLLPPARSGDLSPVFARSGWSSGASNSSNNSDATLACDAEQSKGYSKWAEFVVEGTESEDNRILMDPALVRDMIIGLADGLTVPFGLMAGLSLLGSSRIVVIAGLAELVSGALSMGVGGYLSAQAERDHYRYLHKRTRNRVRRSSQSRMERETLAILSSFGIDSSLSSQITAALLASEASLPSPPPPASELARILGTFRAMWIRRGFTRVSQNSDESQAGFWEGDDSPEKGMTDFLLRFGEGLEETAEGRLLASAFTIGSSYFFGGLVPLLPYFCFATVRPALYLSILVTTAVLLLLGAFKTRFSGADTGWRGYSYGCLSTLAVGGSAAIASFVIVRAMRVE